MFEKKYEENKLSVNFFIPNFVCTDMGGEIIDLVGIQKLEKMYIESLGKEKIDTSGEFLKSLIKKSDLNFLYIFLKKLHELRLKLTDLDYENKLRYIWESENVEGAIKKYFDFLLQGKRVIFIGVDPVLKKIFKNNLQRAKSFIEFEILNTTSEYILINLFNLSFEIFDEESLLGFMTLLKTKKISDDFFRKVHLTMRNTTWTGSRVPLLDKEIDFLNRLIEVFGGTEYLTHALNLNDRVNSLKKIKDNEILSDYLD